MTRTFYAIALHYDGKILPETYELMSFVRDMGGKTVTFIILGSDPHVITMARELAEKTGMEVICALSEHLENYHSQGYRDALKKLVFFSEPTYVCIPHTATGYDFAPRLAASINIPCITAIEGIEGGSFIRSMYGGRIRARAAASAPSAVLTIQPGAWEGPLDSSGSSGEVEIIPVEIASDKTRTHGYKKTTFQDVGFSDADVIISAGRGIGSPQNLALIKSLAALFPRSAIGATRAVCDLGWLGYRHQIGITGNTVSPRLYIACGISGAVQHISGMKNSRIIVAINSDPHAAIFRASTYCIVEDLKTFIPLVLEEYSRRSDLSEKGAS
ncbi:MAG TPA: electron transfer flavoprotein subunit alpha/FixB family protein [Deltaproteobacteria bacterium]|nr:electron transfer flavoprotein subunit alpha/FixB family protein [Deltaproteobacteria bacterium]